MDPQSLEPEPGSPSSSSAPVPRYEVHIDPRAPRTVAGTARLVVLAFVAAALMVRMPYVIGASVALPLAFAWIGLRLGTVRPRATTLRFFEDALEVATPEVVDRIGWEHFEEVKETAEGLTIALPGGRQILIPKALLPADRRTLIDALPAHVRFEVVAAIAPKGSAGKTIALWFVLIGLFCVIYYAVSQP